MLELHEQVALHWGRRRATNCHWLFAAAVLEEHLEGIVLSTVAVVLELVVLELVVLELVVGIRQVEAFRRQDCRYMLEEAAVLWEEVQLRHCMGLSVAGRRLVELLRVADSVTNSMLILRLPEEAEYLVVLERQVADSPLAVELRLAMLRQGRALAFEHTRLEAHQLDHTELAARSHRLVVAGPLPRCKLVASGFGIQRVKEGVPLLTLLLLMRRRHDEP
jgi:hypothetical protein